MNTRSIFSCNILTNKCDLSLRTAGFGAILAERDGQVY
jgi:hypothetical protein